MKNTNEKQIKIKKPILVLNNATKTYLATKEISNGQSDFFFIVSLFIPQIMGKNTSGVQTEIVAFEDAESASIYRETLEQYCDFNEKYLNSEIYSAHIKYFKQTADKLIQQNDEKIR